MLQAMKHVRADDFQQANWLAKLATEHLLDINEDNKRQNLVGRSAPGLAASSGHVPLELGLADSSRARTVEITWGSICSGSEGVLPVLRAIEQAYATRKVQVQFKHIFSCEKSKEKQRWISQIFAEFSGHDDHDDCLFTSAEEMGNPTAHCVVHDKYCPVPDVHLLVVGTSCKDLSRANPNQNMAAVKESSSPGGSGNTFQGLLQYLDKHNVEVMIFENVDTLTSAPSLEPAAASGPAPAASKLKSASDANESARDKETTALKTMLQYVCEKFVQRGLRPLRLLTDSSLFGVPQARRRVYILGVRHVGNALFDFGLWPCEKIFGRCKEMLKLCQRVPPCLSKVLLSDEDPLLSSPGEHARQDLFSVWKVQPR